MSNSNNEMNYAILENTFENRANSKTVTNLLTTPQIRFDDM
jgi:hypothetical protein